MSRNDLRLMLSAFGTAWCLFPPYSFGWQVAGVVALNVAILIRPERTP